MAPQFFFRTLRGRLLMLTTGLVALVVAAVSSYLMSRQTEQLVEMRRRSADQIRQALETKGLALSRNVARASERALATMDFLFVNEVIRTTVENDAAIVYGIVMDNERKALVHTDADLLRQVLDDDVSRVAQQQAKDAIHPFEADGAEFVEAISPLMLDDKRWTVRFGVSLASVNAAIARAEAAAAEQSQQNRVVLTGVAALMAVLAILLGSYLASWIVRPLDELTEGVSALRQGDLERRVEVSGRVEELAELATGFNSMTDAVRERDAQLRQNMTELEQALAQAEEASRIKSEFLANISHELRTPLNAIVNVPASLLREYEVYKVWVCEGCDAVFKADASKFAVGDRSEDPCPTCSGAVFLRDRTYCIGKPEEHTHFLRRLKQSGRHLLNVVTDLLDFSKLEAGKMTLFLDDLEVNGALTELEETVGPLAEEAGVQLELVPADPPFSMRVDQVKLNQILINLVGNAIKFTPKGGVIRVTIDREQGARWATFSVTDTGIGIAADKLDMIFESFRQADGSHTRSHGGTGLGLAITRQLVELHGGNISVRSEVDKGSTFEFVLPQFGAETANDNDETVGSRSKGRRVVVVDDNRVHLELARMVLERGGYEVEIHGTAENIVADLRDNPPHAVVLDVMMPGISGLAVLRELKNDPTTRELPVIVSTAYHSNSNVVRQLGGVWLPKPWDEDHFLHVVDGAVKMSLAPPASVRPSQAPVGT